MADIQTCLQSVIGLSEESCVCYPNEPEAFDSSLSGQFINDMEHGIPLVFPANITECGANNVWNRLVEARKQGINDFVTEFLLKLTSTSKAYLDDFRSTFGEEDKNGKNSSMYDQSAISAFIVEPKIYKGVMLQVHKVGIAIDTPGTYEVKIFANEGLINPVHTYSINILNAGVLTYKTEEQTLPLYDSRGEPVTYLFTYENQGGHPFNYKYHCGCGVSSQPPWVRMNYLRAYGASTDTVEDLKYKTTGTGFSNGLIVDFSLKCDATNWLCSQADTFWTNSAWGRVAAKTLVLKSNVKLIQAILNDTNPSYFTLLGREALYGKRAHFTKLSSDLIKWLVQHLPGNLSHCYFCQPGNNFSKSEMLA